MVTNNVTIESKVDGLWIKNGHLSAGPFQTLNDRNPVQVAPRMKVEPKQVLKAKLRECAIQYPGHKKKALPAFLPSMLATCFKKRFWDVGDCDLFDCSYLDWCILQLKAIKEGAVLLFHERNPLKCSICRRRLATNLLYVKRGPRDPKSVFPACSSCEAQIPERWPILEARILE
jgi:hypothetical protein